MNLRKTIFNSLWKNIYHHFHKASTCAAFFTFSLEFSSLMLLKLSIPGILLPCINSTLAPPPVDINETLSWSPSEFTKFTESPPPITEVALYSVRFTIVLNSSSLPFLNSGISKTPTGPFQKIELAFLIVSLKTPTDFGPMSKAFHPSSIPWLISKTLVSTPPFIYFAAMQSNGKWILLFFSLALFRTLCKSYLFSGSWTLVPPSLNPKIYWTKG